MLYCINNLKKGHNTAGIKAPQDVFVICRKLGFKEIKFYEPTKRKSVISTRIGAIPTGINNWMRLCRMTKSGDWVLLQHPNENIVIGNHFIKHLRKKGIHFIALIHDLETLRKSLSGNENELKDRNNTADNVLLKMCDYVICHNAVMKDYLVRNGFDKDRVFELEIFDYLHNCELQTGRKKDAPIIIAGNLMEGKCGYLYKMTESGNVPFSLNLYGPNYVESKSINNINYFGSLPPDELPGKLEGSFGLVWDGTEIDRCAGNAGEYIKYNNPHKCSLFLASGIPVIIWKHAALAPFIEKNNLGITVESLNDIKEAVDRLNDTDYEQMLAQTLEISRKLRKGYYLRKVLNKIGILKRTKE